MIAYNRTDSIFNDVVTSISNESFSSTDSFITVFPKELEFSYDGTNINEITITFSNGFTPGNIVSVIEFVVKIELTFINE